jgi:hypothetical protein
MFAVIWTDYALDRLADVFVSLDLLTQDQLTAEIDALNHRLASDPLREGESRTSPYRMTFAGSLGVLFRVETSNGVVRVTEVKWHGP